MNTYEDYITHNGIEYYLCTEYAFDHADRLQLSGFVLTDEDGEDISQDDFEADKDFYDKVCTILANESEWACHGRVFSGRDQHRRLLPGVVTIGGPRPSHLKR